MITKKSFDCLLESGLSQIAGLHQTEVFATKTEELGVYLRGGALPLAPAAHTLG